MTYAECVAQFPNAPAVYCLEISGDMGQSSVTPPPVTQDPSWQLPTPLQLQVYTRNGYIFCVKRILGKVELFGINPDRGELINFSSGKTMKDFFGAFNTEGLISAVDYITLPPNVPFSLLALCSVNKNKICRVIPNSGGQTEVIGYPPQLSYLTLAGMNTPPAGSSSGGSSSSGASGGDEIANFTGNPPPRYNPNDGAIKGETNYIPYILGAGLLLFILK